MDSDCHHHRIKDVSFKAIIILIFVFSYGTLSPSRCISQEENLPRSLFSFEQIMSEDGTIDWAFGDFDGDGIEEYARTEGNGVVVMDLIGGSLRTAGDLVGRSTVLCLRALDVTGDSYPDIRIGILKGSTVWTEVWTCSSSSGKHNYSRLLKTEPVTVTDLNRDGRWDGEIAGYQVIDVNDDEYVDILVAVTAGYDMYPRGLLAFDGKTGRKLWAFPVAGHPYPQVCADLNNDSEMAIIIGDRAPCNGNRAGDMDDCHSHIMCLDRHGDLMWNYETGGVFTRSAYAISVLNGDGSKKVICTYASGNIADEPTHFELQVRNGARGEVENVFSHPTEFSQPYVNDFDRDGVDEIVIGKEDGWLYLFSHNLAILKNA